MDNASSEMGDGRWEMGKNLNARIVREEKLGLTHARVRGFQEAKGEIVVMVDDDNVLKPDYLERAVEILEKDSERFEKRVGRGSGAGRQRGVGRRRRRWRNRNGDAQRSKLEGGSGRCIWIKMKMKIKKGGIS